MEKLLDEIKNLNVNFTDQARWAVGGNKSAGRRSRLISKVIERKLKEWRKISIAAEK